MKKQSIFDFVDNTIETIDKKILILSEAQIEDIFEEVHLFSEDPQDEWSILVLLSAKAKEKIDYHCVRRHEMYDHAAFIHGIKVFIVAVALFFLLYFFGQHCFSHAKNLKAVAPRYPAGDLWHELLIAQNILIWSLKRSMIICLIISIYMCLKSVFHSICTFLWPYHKQRYERWCIIRQKIEYIIFANK